MEGICPGFETQDKRHQWPYKNANVLNIFPQKRWIIILEVLCNKKEVTIRSTWGDNKTKKKSVFKI